MQPITTVHKQLHTVKESIPGDKVFQATTISVMCVSTLTPGSYIAPLWHKNHITAICAEFLLWNYNFYIFGINKSQTFILLK